MLTDLLHVIGNDSDETLAVVTYREVYADLEAASWTGTLRRLLFCHRRLGQRCQVAENPHHPRIGKRVFRLRHDHFGATLGTWQRSSSQVSARFQTMASMTLNVHEFHFRNLSIGV